MNEHLIEFAEESGMTQYVAAHNKSLERFAHLIIKECMTICESVENDDELDGLSDGALLCQIEIKEKFGIK